MSIKLVGFTVCQLLLVRQYWKVMKDKFQRLSSTHKATRFYQQDLIKQPDFGTHKQESFCKLWKVTRTKYFLVCLTTKEILSLQVRKTIHAKSGGIHRFTKINDLTLSVFQGLEII